MLSERNNQQQDLADLMNVLAYSDGELDLLDIAETTGRPQWELLDTVQKLKEHGLLRGVGEGRTRYE